MKNLIMLEQNVILTTSLIIADEINLEHRSIFRMVKKYENDLKEFGVLRFEITKPKIGSKGGRPYEFAKLNEPQTSLLIMYLKNTEKVRFFKKSINKQFYQMRMALLKAEANKYNLAWLEARKSVKETRLTLTDAIKEYINYAIKNGSKTYKRNPKAAYILFTKMTAKALFDLNVKIDKNVRNKMEKKQLENLKFAEKLQAKIILEEIKKGTEYHKLYKVVKKEVERFANEVGKSVIIKQLEEAV